MLEPFVAEIRMFAFSFAPTGWAQCNGQELQISQNTALFGLLGTTYGGDGKSTFALPDLQGCAAIHAGQGPDLSLYDLGQRGGAWDVWLGPDETPAHAHTLMATFQVANQGAPAATRTFANSSGGDGYQWEANRTTLSDSSLGTAGGGAPHNNLQPLLGVNFCIALQGIFPPRPDPPQRAPESQASD